RPGVGYSPIGRLQPSPVLADLERMASASNGCAGRPRKTGLIQPVTGTCETLRLVLLGMRTYPVPSKLNALPATPETNVVPPLTEPPLRPNRSVAVPSACQRLAPAGFPEIATPLPRLPLDRKST